MRSRPLKACRTPWRHSLMEVEKSAARAAEISNELGVFSQQEKQTRRAPPGNLNAVVVRCVEFFKNTLGEKVAWNLNLDKELFASRFDEAKLQQALTKVQLKREREELERRYRALVELTDVLVVALDDDGRITRARLRPASARNWRGFDDACRSQNVFTDIPIIEASFWLTAAGLAR